MQYEVINSFISQTTTIIDIYLWILTKWNSHWLASLTISAIIVNNHHHHHQHPHHQHLSSCLPDCSGHGSFDLNTGTCKCTNHWTGLHCNISELTCSPSFCYHIFCHHHHQPHKSWTLSWMCESNNHHHHHHHLHVIKTLSLCLCLQRCAALTVAPTGLARATPVAVTRAGQVHYHPDHHHCHPHHHHCYCYHHNQDRHDHDHGPHPFLYDQLIIIWLELHQLQISSSSQLSSSSSLLPTLSPSSQSSPSHAQNLNSVPQVQLALAAPAATDVKTMGSAPMAPVSVSKGGMESKLLLLSYFCCSCSSCFCF